MPDNTKNFTYDGTNGPIGATTVTRAELITAMEHMNYAEGYNIRAIDELGGSGLISVDSLGNAYARSIAGSNGLTVSNATGVSGNPTVGIGTPSTVRQAIDDTEANTVTNSVAVSILSSGTSYAVPAPASGVISRKTIINNSASMITLTGAVWENPGITTVRIVPRGSVTLVSGVGGFWHVIHPYVGMPHGGIYVSSSAATTISDTTNYFAAAGTTTAQPDLNQFDMPANGRLRYTGKVPAHAHLVISTSLTSASNSQVVHLRIGYYDDSAATTTYLEHSEIDQKTQATGGDIIAAALHGDLVMEENDYIFCAIRNDTSSTNVTLNFCYIFAMGMPQLTT